MDQIDLDQREQTVEQIDSGRITKMAEGIDRVVGPKRDAIGECFDIGDVQSEVTEIVSHMWSGPAAAPRTPLVPL